jgi:hypothetical protein
MAFDVYITQKKGQIYILFERIYISTFPSFLLFIWKLYSSFTRFSPTLSNLPLDKGYFGKHCSNPVYCSRGNACDQGQQRQV